MRSLQIYEIQKVINQKSYVKAPGIDGIPAEVIKLCSSSLLPHLSELVELIWKEESVPQDFKDAVIVHIYKQIQKKFKFQFFYSDSYIDNSVTRARFTLLATCR